MNTAEIMRQADNYMATGAGRKELLEAVTRMEAEIGIVANVARANAAENDRLTRCLQEVEQERDRLAGILLAGVQEYELHDEMDAWCNEARLAMGTPR
jgi:hypothetical protein